MHYHYTTLASFFLFNLASSSPLPTPILAKHGPARVQPRNLGTTTSGGTPTMSGYLQQQTATMTSTSATSSSSSSNGYWLGGGSAFDPNVHSLPQVLLNAVGIVVLVAVIITVAVARYLQIRKFYPVTFRNFFIPIGGIHINWLKIHVQGPPPRPLPQSPAAAMRSRRRRERAQRDRTTFGPGIGMGGARDGARDEDDIVEGDDSTTTREGLPKYEVDLALPPYAVSEGEMLPPPGAGGTTFAQWWRRPAVGDGRDRIERGQGEDEAQVAGGGGAEVVGVLVGAGGEEEELPSVQAYEEATRAGGRTGGTNTPNRVAQVSVMAREDDLARETEEDDHSISGSTVAGSSSRSTLTKDDLVSSSSSSNGKDGKKEDETEVSHLENAGDVGLVGLGTRNTAEQEEGEEVEMVQIRKGSQ
ncbi:hypothetical protein T439DRAFT_382913 [Meredithblackwellia eburnea MCA 4105]